MYLGFSLLGNIRENTAGAPTIKRKEETTARITGLAMSLLLFRHTVSYLPFANFVNMRSYLLFKLQLRNLSEAPSSDV